MSVGPTIEFSHDELSLILFALEGCPDAGSAPEAPSCEDSCPVISNIDEMFSINQVAPEQRLARHLSNHLREGLVECGMLEFAGSGVTGSVEQLSQSDDPRIRLLQERLRRWSCEIQLDTTEVRVLFEALYRLPRAAWLSMPRLLWRLRRKLKRASREA
jgi:hypothetical protein